MENEAPAMSLYIANHNMKSLPPLPPLVVKKVDGRSVPGSKAPFRNGLISVEEMTRLMRVYGPIKSTRESKKSADKKPVKLLSIKRKFYRWFPDFDDRQEWFVQTKEGWYQPKIGHEAEMKYREAKRLEDEMAIIKYRVARRKENALKKKLAQRVEEAAGCTTAVRFLMQYLPMKLLRPRMTYMLDPPDVMQPFT
eukprot:scaffold21961_cov67-Cyclotella_meneghiniana.AAC.5